MNERKTSMENITSRLSLTEERISEIEESPFERQLRNKNLEKYKNY